MLGLLRSPSKSAGTAIGYITVGVLMMIWTGIWYYSMMGQDGTPPWQRYTCMGLFLSGLAIMVIGLLVGQIGSAAKRADNTVGAVSTAPVVQQPAVMQQPAVAQLPAGDAAARVN